MPPRAFAPLALALLAFGAGAAQPNEFMRFEEWRDPAALEAHKATPHLKASFEKRKQQGWRTEITLWRRVPD